MSFGIGYALAPKKEQSFIQVSLVNLARSRGIELIRVDSDRPLTEQGPFDCIIHKLPGEGWKSQLRDYADLYPNVFIIDQPEAIERLHNRVSMLQVVSDLVLPRGLGYTLGVPNQAELCHHFAELPSGLRFPVVAKPLVADGSASSHLMALVFNADGLRRLKPPMILQDFVNHGGVVFKVYVVGDYVTCVKRRSLPDISDDDIGGSSYGLLPFSQISNHTGGSSADNNEKAAKCIAEEAEMPPVDFITEIARCLQHAMQLHLFNFDVIRDAKISNRYLVIDINYFPGYAKMPSYEVVLTDFFWDLHQKQRKISSLQST